MVEAGDICAVVGLDSVDIGNTIADADDPKPLPIVRIDEPTLHMTFRVNDSPFTGRSGKYLTSGHIRERLDKELQRNVSLRVEPGPTPEEFHVSGRGVLHLSVLIENMRREGYELAVGKPKVIFREIERQEDRTDRDMHRRGADDARRPGDGFDGWEARDLQPDGKPPGAIARRVHHPRPRTDRPAQPFDDGDAGHDHHASQFLRIRVFSRQYPPIAATAC